MKQQLFLEVINNLNTSALIEAVSKTEGATLEGFIDFLNGLEFEEIVDTDRSEIPRIQRAETV